VIGDKERALFDLEPLPKTEAEIRRQKHKEEKKRKAPIRFLTLSFSKHHNYIVPMFYSRPDIPSLNWDLKELPVEFGSRNHHATTTDGHFIDIRFSSGWLTVSVTKHGANEPEEIIKKPIAPFGTTDIFSEQICDILGLTVNGEKIDHPYKKLEQAKKGSARYIDLSGKTTYWVSNHRTLLRNDADEFLDTVQKAFPSVALIQTQWDSAYKSCKNRQVAFLMDDDTYTTIGIGNDKFDILNTKITSEFPFFFNFNKSSRFTTDLTGKNHLDDKYDLSGEKLSFEVQNHNEYKIYTEFQTEDKTAQKYMKTLSDLIDECFTSDLQAYDLKDHKTIVEDSPFQTPSISLKLKEWCIEKPNRYISVYALKLTKDSEPIFLGHKPI
tara:strand:+ start:730 stop:1875 length:1146 start_codon:yes stop_codon:yes gene_type:complete